MIYVSTRAPGKSNGTGVDADRGAAVKGFWVRAMLFGWRRDGGGGGGVVRSARVRRTCVALPNGTSFPIRRRVEWFRYEQTVAESFAEKLNGRPKKHVV